MQFSKLIDLETFDDWPENCALPNAPWDLVGILVNFPHITDLKCGIFRWTFTVYQSENSYVNIEFNTDRERDEPKFQRLVDCAGQLIFIRHLLPIDEGRAGLYAPYDRPQNLWPHYNHRTIFCMDTSYKYVEQFEKVFSY